MFSTFRGLQSSSAITTTSPWEGWNGAADGSSQIADNSENYLGTLTAPINSSQFMLLGLYSTTNSSIGLYGWIGTVTGTSVAYGGRAPFSFSPDGINPFSICQLDSNWYIAVYVAFGSPFLTANLISVQSPTASSITDYGQTIVDSGSSQDQTISQMEIVKLTSSTALMFYYDVHHNLQTVVLSRSGNSVIVGTPYQVTGGIAWQANSISAISPTQVVLCGPSTDGTQIISVGLPISGTSITGQGSLTSVASISGAVFSTTQATIGNTKGIVASFVARRASDNFEALLAVYFTIDASNNITTYNPAIEIVSYSGAALIGNVGWTQSLNNNDLMMLWSSGSFSPLYGTVAKVDSTTIIPSLVNVQIATSFSGSGVFNGAQIAQLNANKVACGLLQSISPVVPVAVILQSD